MKDKVVKAWAKAIKKREKCDCKRFNVVILFPVIWIYWAKAKWWQSGDCGWIKMQIEGGVVKAFSDAKHAPETW